MGVRVLPTWVDGGRRDWLLHAGQPGGGRRVVVLLLLAVLALLVMVGVAKAAW